jgi:hypothetical protein
MALVLDGLRAPRKKTKLPDRLVQGQVAISHYGVLHARLWWSAGDDDSLRAPRLHSDHWTVHFDHLSLRPTGVLANLGDGLLPIHVRAAGRTSIPSYRDPLDRNALQRWQTGWMRCPVEQPNRAQWRSATQANHYGGENMT